MAVISKLIIIIIIEGLTRDNVGKCHTSMGLDTTDEMGTVGPKSETLPEDRE